MAIDKLVTTRKEHTCTCCGEVIPKGNKAWYVSEKMPKYEYTPDDEEKQIGIDYFRAYFCYDKAANFECNSEGGVEIITMVPSCALDDVIAGEEQCIITDVSQQRELLIDFCEVYATGNFGGADAEDIVDWYLKVKDN